MHLRENIDSVLDRWGITQKEFASLIGIDDQLITHWKAGRSLPRIPILIRLELRTGIPVSQWFLREIRAGEFPPEPLPYDLVIESDGTWHVIRTDSKEVAEPSPAYQPRALIEQLQELSQLMQQLEQRIQRLENRFESD